MSSIQQLRLDLTSTGDQPSANLVIYFKVGLHVNTSSTPPPHDAHPNPLCGGVDGEAVCGVGGRSSGGTTGLAGDRKVASSIPGSSWLSVEVSLSETPHPDGPRRTGCRPAGWTPQGVV